MIVSNPKLAAKKEANVVSANQVWYETFGKCLWKSCAKAATKPTAVVKQVTVIKTASTA